jgi:hypothetical protein
MFGIGNKKKDFEEEDLCCRFCEYASIKDGEDSVFCTKKKCSKDPLDNCSSFAYDLLKRRPAARKGKEALCGLEFPVI